MQIKNTFKRSFYLLVKDFKNTFFSGGFLRSKKEAVSQLSDDFAVSVVEQNRGNVPARGGEAIYHENIKKHLHDKNFKMP